MRLRRVLGVALASVCGSALVLAKPPRETLPPGALSWQERGEGGIRGLTVGPIESRLHPKRGYGSDPCHRTMRQATRMGANWVSLTPFGRVFDLRPTGVDLTFEAPFADNRKAVARAVQQAHDAGLRVLLVPHLWVESGEWRALIDPGTDAGWRTWARGYEQFLLAWAEVAAESRVDMLSVGVELRSWVTTSRAPSFLDVIAATKKVYPGLLTYSANWDDAEDTVIFGAVDVIGVNAFFPLAKEKGAPVEQLRDGARGVAEKMRALSEAWQKPVLFTEAGYTTRPDPAFEPWTWPDTMAHVTVDERAQAEAYEALLAPMLDEPWFMGFFVWRVYADPYDASQEAEWGFSPRGKLAELVMRDAFAASWAVDGPRARGIALTRVRTEPIGKY